MREVALDRPNAHEQGVGDLSVGPSGGGEFRHACLGLGELPRGGSPATDPGELGASLVGPQRCTEPLEDGQGLLERLPGGPLLLGPAPDRAQDQHRSAELKGHRKALVLVQRPIEGGEGGLEVAICGGEKTAVAG